MRLCGIWFGHAWMHPCTSCVLVSSCSLSCCGTGHLHRRQALDAAAQILACRTEVRATRSSDCVPGLRRGGMDQRAAVPAARPRFNYSSLQFKGCETAVKRRKTIENTWPPVRDFNAARQPECEAATKLCKDRFNGSTTARRSI
jgi:hypothetical protein